MTTSHVCKLLYRYLGVCDKDCDNHWRLDTKCAGAPSDVLNLHCRLLGFIRSVLNDQSMMVSLAPVDN